MTRVIVFYFFFSSEKANLLFQPHGVSSLSSHHRNSYSCAKMCTQDDDQNFVEFAIPLLPFAIISKNVLDCQNMAIHSIDNILPQQVTGLCIDTEPHNCSCICAQRNYREYSCNYSLCVHPYLCFHVCVFFAP